VCHLGLNVGHGWGSISRSGKCQAGERIRMVMGKYPGGWAVLR
jgi:hypothetical protein